MFREILESNTHYVIVSKDRKEMFSEAGEVRPFNYEDVAANKAQGYQTFIYKDKKKAEKAAKSHGAKVVSVDLDKEPFAGATAD